MNEQWYTVGGKKIDNIHDELEEFKDSENVIIHIGTDAQAKGHNKANFVTVIVVYTMSKGGRIFYWRDKNISFFSLWDKLYGETERSLRIATDLEKHFGIEFGSKIMVHVDANEDKRWASSSYVKQLAGMVMGYGFKYVLKPDAWAASHCADHIVKGKHQGR